MTLRKYLSIFIYFFSTVYAQNTQEQGIYNKSSQISVKKPWGIFLSGSFIYWQARQEGLEIAIANPTSNLSLPALDATLVKMRFNYKPGFKVEIGYRYKFDDSIGRLEYTRFYQTTNESSSRPNPPGGSLKPIWLNEFNTGVAVNTSAKWKLNIDIIDGDFSRKYLAGERLILHPFFGIRAAWIDQKFKLAYFISTFNVNSDSKSNSWGVGPRVGIKSDWILGWGFYGHTNTSTAILYSRYRINHEEKSISNPNITSLKLADKVDFLRPSLTLDIGLGWGVYFIENKFHIDIRAGYDFSIFWHQNMMKKLVDNFNQQFVGAQYDLYLQGLTAKLQFDF